jgi:hypothetical protein
VDAQVTASVLGLLPVDANLKARYSVPEIWIADEDRGKVEAAAARLALVEMRGVVRDAADFGKIPSQLIVTGFTFDEHKLTLHLPTATLNIGYDHPGLIVPCTPRAAEGTPPPPHKVAGMDVHDDSSFVDLYLKSKQDWLRLAIFAEHVDFEGLGAHKTASAARNMLNLLQMLQRRFTVADYDDRLVNMQLRRRPGPSTPAQLKDARKGYSYASPGLLALLEIIAPQWKDCSQSELSSRLVFLTASL